MFGLCSSQVCVAYLAFKQRHGTKQGHLMIRFTNDGDASSIKNMVIRK